MKPRALVNGVLVLGSLALLWAVSNQRHELLELREQQQHRLTQSTNAFVPAGTAQINESDAPPLVSSPSVSRELLRLRNEVNGLARRRQELVGFKAENEQLLVRVAARRTNTTATLPPGYLRRSEAAMVGYGSPEATLQSFLWAIRNRDVTNMLQAFTPEAARRFKRQSGGSKGGEQNAFEGMDAIIGLAVVGREPQADGTIKTRVMIIPELPPAEIQFQQIGGEWKMNWPPEEGRGG